MAHKAQRQFCLRVKEHLTPHFSGVRVLDVGSLDINGNNRYLFEDASYLGIDVAEGRNVDQVALAHELDEPDESFDVIISTECFEHDMYFSRSLKNIVRMLKSGGLFLFTCATTGRKEHGTAGADPADSPLTSQLDNQWSAYYKNLSEEDIREAINVDDIFRQYHFEVNKGLFDLYFWGLKH